MMAEKVGHRGGELEEKLDDIENICFIGHML